MGLVDRNGRPHDDDRFQPLMIAKFLEIIG